LAPTFNLLLSFVDGQGLSYIGTAMGGGRPECCLLYVAAMSDGKTLGATVTLLNSFLESTGIGQAVYIAVGLPTSRARIQNHDGGDSNRAVRLDPGSDYEYSIDFGERNFGTCILDSPVAIELALLKRLGLNICHDTELEVMWFCTLEEYSQSLCISFFSFPKPLNCIRFTVLDVEDQRQCVRAKLNSIQRWIDYHRRVVGSTSDGAAAGQQAHTHYREILPPIMDRLSFDGSASNVLASVMARMDDTSKLLRDLLLLELNTPLSGAFWLSNALAPDQFFVHAEPSVCPACGGTSYLRNLKSYLSDDRRIVNICMRCGILQDVPRNSAFQEMKISCPVTAMQGAQLRVSVEIHSVFDKKEFVLVGAISGPYSPKIFSQTVRVNINREVATASFTFEIPHTMPLHEFRWKCVVADEDDIAFVSRCFFVNDGAV
jgi:hypothetical protein